MAGTVFVREAETGDAPGGAGGVCEGSNRYLKRPWWRCERSEPRSEIVKTRRSLSTTADGPDARTKCSKESCAACTAVKTRGQGLGAQAPTTMHPKVREEAHLRAAQALAVCRRSWIACNTGPWCNQLVFNMSVGAGIGRVARLSAACAGRLLAACWPPGGRLAKATASGVGRQAQDLAIPRLHARYAFCPTGYRPPGAPA